MIRKKTVLVDKETEVKPGKTLLLSTTEGEVRISIPSGARVTFGPTIPFERKSATYNPNPGGYSLRVYENSKNDSLIAVFSGVKGFRDISIPHAKLVIREAGKSVWKSDEEGYKVEQEVKNSQHWSDSLHQLEDGE